MSDTTNVMKGTKSGVEKLECPNLYDVGCICHLADLTIKAGMETLPININQLFVDVFYIVARESKNLLILAIILYFRTNYYSQALYN